MIDFVVKYKIVL